MNQIGIKNKIENTNINQAISLLYSSEDEDKEQLFWESINEPYREILEECYYTVEEGKFSRLEVITNNIKSNRLSYIKLGIKLYQVKLYKLYKNQYKSFKEYCELAINYPVWRANQAIETSGVAIKLIKNGFNIIPQNQAQARLLVKLNDSELIEKWQEILDHYPAYKITANRIEKIIYGEIRRKQGHLKLPIKILREIENKALENGLSASELISKIFQGQILINSDGSMENNLNDNQDVVQNLSPKIIEKWEKDLDKLAFKERNKIDDFVEELAEELQNTVTDLKLVIKKHFLKSFLQPLFNCHTNLF